jgi:hypothetical protein
MNREQITENIDRIQQALNEIGRKLLESNPQAQNLVGRLTAYNEMLSEDDEPEDEAEQ